MDLDSGDGTWPGRGERMEETGATSQQVGTTDLAAGTTLTATSKGGARRFPWSAHVTPGSFDKAPTVSGDLAGSGAGCYRA